MAVLCPGLPFEPIDPHEKGFEECWKEMVEWADNVPILEECEDCIFQGKCTSCVATHYGDMGEFNKVSPLRCFEKLYPEAAAKAQAAYDREQAQQAGDTQQ